MFDASPNDPTMTTIIGFDTSARTGRGDPEVIGQFGRGFEDCSSHAAGLRGPVLTGHGKEALGALEEDGEAQGEQEDSVDERT
jgi:hypothetical protein